MQKCISSKIYNIDFSIKEYELNKFLEKIKTMGNVYYEFEFENPIKDKNEEQEYTLSGEKENIITKVLKTSWVRILSKNILNEQKEYNLKVKILKSQSKQIMIGLAQTIPDIVNKNFIYSLKSLQNFSSVLKKKSLMFYLTKKIGIDLIFNYGWYYCLSSSYLFSDSPQNYRSHSINIDSKIQDEITININMKEGKFNLILDNNNIKCLYDNIPLDKPLAFSVLLLDENDSIEIISL